jgi:hypothetical protein
MKRRVLAVIEKADDAMAWYRSVLPLLRLKRSHGIEVDFMMISHRPTWDLLVQYDILFMQRPHDVKYVDLAGLAKLHKLKVWLDFDDPLWSVNPDSPVHGYYQQEDTRQAIERCVNLSDVITVSTLVLAQSVKEYYNKEAVVIVNSADLDGLQWMAKGLKEKPVKPVLAWRGSLTHQEDIMQFKPVMDELDNERDIAWRFYGADMYWAKKGLKNVTQIGSMDFTLYQQTLRVDPGQIMFVPLVDNHFNRCKSDIAAIEAVVAGMIPVVPNWWGLGQRGGKEGIEKVLDASEEEKQKIWQRNVNFIADCRNLTTENLKRLQVIEGL